MAKFRFNKNSLIGGEISPTAMGRTDLSFYPHACKTLRNMIPMPTGGAYRRPGTRYEGKLESSTDYAPRLFPFIVSRDEAYALYIEKVIGGDGVMGGFRVTDNTGTNSTATITGTHDYEVATLNNTNGSYDEVHDIQYVQSADVMWLVHGNRKPKKLTRTDTDTFTLDDFDSGLTGTSLRDAYPYLKQNSTSTTIYPSATTGTGITLTASASVFTAGHVGALFKIALDNGSGTTIIGCAKITAYTSGTSVTADVVVDFGSSGSANKTTNWWESAWSDHRGWPRAIGFFQQRLAYAGTASDQDSIWFSETADYAQLSHDFIYTTDRSTGDVTTTTNTVVSPEDGPEGDMAFTVTLAEQQVNLINWLSADKTLLVGTLNDEFVIDRGTGAWFGCDSINVVRQSSYGSSLYQPVRVGRELIFCRSNMHELTSIVFDEVQQAYVDESIQLLYDEFPKSDAYATRKYRSFAWDRSRRTLWCCDTDGNLFALTRDRQLQITAWHSHQLGGYDDTITDSAVGTGFDTTLDPSYVGHAGYVVSLCVLPNPILGTDDVWLAVKRKVDGNWRYSFERMIGAYTNMSSAFSPDIVDSFLLDCSLSSLSDYPFTEDYDFTATDFEGETLAGIASNSNGIFGCTFSAVSSGSTTMQKPYPTGIASEITSVVMGYKFDSIVIPVRPDAGSQIGSGQGAVKRIHKATVRFYKTLAAKVGADDDNLETLVFRKGDTPMGESPDLFTGDKAVYVDCDYDTDGYLTIKTDEPLPFAVTSISMEGDLYD